MIRFLENYGSIQTTLEILVKDKKALEDARRADARGYLRVLDKFETIFGLLVSIKIFGPCESLARALQKPGFAATSAIQSVGVLKSTLSDMRSDAAFDTVYQKADELAKKLHLSPPLVPRAKKAPKRYESSDAPTASAQIDAITNLRN